MSRVRAIHCDHDRIRLDISMLTVNAAHARRVLDAIGLLPDMDEDKLDEIEHGHVINTTWDC